MRKIDEYMEERKNVNGKKPEKESQRCKGIKKIEERKF